MIFQIKEAVSREGYDSETFSVALTLPVSFQIRAHSVWIFMRDNFPTICDTKFPLNVVTVRVKDVWKWIVGSQIEEAISKKYVVDSNLDITIIFNYNNNETEAHSL